jgi:hypothetical protein
MTDQNPDALLLVGHAIVKALPGNDRVFSVGVSSETVDLESDLILQKALLDAAPGFLAKGGVLDTNHMSEVGSRYGIQNPKEFVIGKALEVVDLGNRETGIVGQINPDGTEANRFWKSLQSGEVWRSSIFGYPRPDGVIDTRYQKSTEYPDVKRFIVKEIDWCSLALTQTPVNDGISHNAQIMTVKSFVNDLRKVGRWGELLKSEAAPNVHPFALPMPRNRVELLGHHSHHMQRSCPSCASGSGLGNSVAGFRGHFQDCCGADYDTADIHAHALAHLLKRH